MCYSHVLSPWTVVKMDLRAAGVPTFKIGGAFLAAELDAKRAIDQVIAMYYSHVL